MATSYGHRRKDDMAFIALDIALQAIAATARHLPLIAKHDADLARQLKRSLTSIASNMGESQHSDPGNRRARLFNALGSASEARTQLRLAVAFGDVQASEAAAADALLDRTIALLWRLTRGRRRR